MTVGLRMIGVMAANTNRVVALAFHRPIRSAFSMIIGNGTLASNVGGTWIRPMGSNNSTLQ